MAMTTTNEGKKVKHNKEIKFVRKFDRIAKELPKLEESFLASKKAFWREKIQKDGIRNVVAPMVDQSELAFRMFCRKYSAHLCYTPMIHAQLFVNDPTYRRISFTTVEADRPLIVQFCANDPQILLSACQLVEGYCDGVDLNLGCPQLIAKKGHYGAFLQESPELIEQMVSLVHKHCRLPLSTKIRMLSDLPSTIEYAKRIERAGACMLTIHGRTREQKGVNTGLANWDVFRALKRELSIPILANGGIQLPGDIERCMAQTGVDGVMSAEGILSNPLLLHGDNPFSFDVSLEYLDFAERFDAPFSAIRAHIFRICHYSFLKYDDLRERNGICCSLKEFRENIEEMRKRCVEEMQAEGDIQWADQNPWKAILRRSFPNAQLGEISLTELVQSTPHYFCKPYIRPNSSSSEDATITLFRQQKRAEIERLASEAGLSKRQIRKREKRKRNRQKELNRKQTYPKCQRCQQPAGANCANEMCRRCCKFVCLRGIQPGCKAHCFNYEMLLAKGKMLTSAQAEETLDEARTQLDKLNK